MGFTQYEKIKPTIYDAEFTTDIKSTAGTALASKYTWQFTTGVNLAPEVISTIPLDGQPYP
jgi:hypothetical protein